MKDKVMIFMCFFVLTLALVHTESALAATESATELVLAANESVFPNSEECEEEECSVDPGDDKKECPAKSKGACKAAGGNLDEHGFCKVQKSEKTKNCGNGFRKVTTKTVIFSWNKNTKKCKKIQSRTTKCQQQTKKGGGWVDCDDKFCKPCKLND